MDMSSKDTLDGPAGNTRNRTHSSKLNIIYEECVEVDLNLTDKEKPNNDRKSRKKTNKEKHKEKSKANLVHSPSVAPFFVRKDSKGNVERRNATGTQESNTGELAFGNKYTEDKCDDSFNSDLRTRSASGKRYCSSIEIATTTGATSDIGSAISEIMCENTSKAISSVITSVSNLHPPQIMSAIREDNTSINRIPVSAVQTIVHPTMSLSSTTISTAVTPSYKYRDGTQYVHIDPVIHGAMNSGGYSGMPAVSYQFASPINMPVPPNMIPQHIEQPGMIDASMVFMKLQEMQNVLTQIETDVQVLKVSKDDFAQQIEAIQDEQECKHDTIVKQDAELRRCKDQIRVLCNVVSKNQKDLAEMNGKINRMEAKSMRHNIVITGIDYSENENCLSKVCNFFSQKMEITENVEVNAARQLGKSNSAPIIVTLANVAQKAKIYAKVSKLKGKTNRNKQGYNISDQLPEELSEEQRRQRQVIAANRALGEGVKLDMSLMRGTLMVNNETYRKKIRVPTAMQMAMMETDEFAKINAVHTTLGSVKTEKQNKFIVYAARPQNIDHVSDIHKHMSIKHGDATHVIVVYRLPGLNKAYDEDYIDHGEHGAGRRLLRYLVKKDIKPIMLIAVWYYSGIMLGPRRFDIYEELADDAISELDQDLNTTSILQLHQCAPSAATVKPKPQFSTVNHKTAASGHPIRGGYAERYRGRGRGALSYPSPLLGNKFSELQTTTEGKSELSDASTSDWATVMEPTPERWSNTDGSTFNPHPQEAEPQRDNQLSTDTAEKN